MATVRDAMPNLSGWGDDDLVTALSAFALTARDDLARAAREASDPRAFFEDRFRPGDTIPGHFTGYYEPEIDGSLVRSADFPVPLHSEPSGGCTHPRAGIDAQLVGHELVWLRDAVDRFFVQVQGSARICLPEGAMRVGHSAKNGHPYRSIGKLLIDRGIFGPDITSESLKTWLRADPARGQAIMDENPSYVFFHKLDVDTTLGPIVTAGCPATTGRTLAVDPDHIPLGIPVWVEVGDIRRLCIAQDTGSAIKGAGRGDIFFGTGTEAGIAAGRLNHGGRFTPLIPR